MPRPRSLAATAALGLACAVLPAAPAAADDAALRARLDRQLGAAGPYSGAYVYNVTDRRAVYRRRHLTPRILASNVKLFTLAAVFGRLGRDGRLRTRVRGVGELDEAGVWTGDLYLRGGGDPSFGSRRFVIRAYGGGATVETLAARLQQAGIASVRGRVYGDELRFDSRRGGPDSGYRTSVYVGPLSALAFNRGLARENGSAFQTNPPLFAARRLTAALEARGIQVSGRAAVGRTPPGARSLASIGSPTVARLARLTLKPSDNFFAELLVKGLAVQPGRWGTTARGAAAAAAFARRLGAKVRLVDGSGLARANRASPWRVTRLLLALRRRPWFRDFYTALPVAGREGTLKTRMRFGPARGRCRAKTGTLSNVSALSGFCRSRSGDLYAFSILMNGVYPYRARRLQDRMAHALAGSQD
jgi:D-alanyl-D-alanine carboxypeptidase/D-alanyl-D-alanine-endopeptidase (penicillin-binding protein 4)